MFAQAVSRGSFSGTPAPDGMPAGAITLQPDHLSGTAQVTLSTVTSTVQLLLASRIPKWAIAVVV